MPISEATLTAPPSQTDAAKPRRRTRIDVDPVTAYAESVIDGKVVAGRLVIAACKRHLRDIETAAKRGWKWDVSAALYAIRFFRFLKHSKGRWARKTFELSPWQAFCVGSVAGWRSIKTGKRRFRTALIVVAKKNGKSVMLAGGGCFYLTADGEEGAEVYSAATARDQAKIIFDEARRMVEKSPALNERVRRFARTLAVDETASVFRPLSSDASTGDGLNPSAVLIDELHRHKSRAMLDLMDSAGGAREQPILWIITTAGDDDPVSPYNTEFDYAEKVVLGVVKDDSYFAYLATLDPGDQWDDPKVWIKANPNLGTTVDPVDLKRQAIKARNNPALQPTFKRLRMNIRVSDSAKAIDLDQWRKCVTGDWRPELLVGRSCFAGLDLASKIDLSAFVRFFPKQGDETKHKVVCRFWLPQARLETLAARDAAYYGQWVRDGWIEATPGNIVDQEAVRRAVLEDHKASPIESLAYDPWNATKIAQELYDADVPTIEFIQGTRSYNAPTNEMLSLVENADIDHGGNPVLEWMATNLKVQTDKNLNKMPHKAKSTGKIDGMTALIMAIGRWHDAKSSVYEDGDFFM